MSIRTRSNEAKKTKSLDETYTISDETSPEGLSPIEEENRHKVDFKSTLTFFQITPQGNQSNSSILLNRQNPSGRIATPYAPKDTDFESESDHADDSPLCSYTPPSQMETNSHMEEVREEEEECAKEDEETPETVKIQDSDVSPHMSSPIIADKPKKEDEQSQVGPEKPTSPTAVITTDEESLCESMIMDHASLYEHTFSSEELKTFSAGYKSRNDTETGNSLLWSEQFTPKRSAKYFTNRFEIKEICEWFDQWEHRLKKIREQEQVQSKKRRRMTLDSDPDNAYDLETTEKPKNPLILAGPTGCGKTAAVYCAAEEHGFGVIEVSPSSRRNGSTLEQKLAGAIDSFNVRRESGTILEMFASQNGQSPAMKRHNAANVLNTAILIDECDIVFASDDNFWSTLKSICERSKVPILLTCNDYDYVRDHLRKDPGLNTYRTLHMQMPSTQVLARNLRAWLIGFTQTNRKIGPLYELIDSKGKDPRAILNTLQLDQYNAEMSKGANVAKPMKTEEDGDMHVYARKMVALAELDASFALPKPVTWRARERPDLDYMGDIFDDRVMDYVQMLQQVNAYYKWPISIKASDCVPPVNKAVHNAYRRLHFRDQHPLKAVALDELPCLLSLDRHYNNNRETNNHSKREPPHPFDIVDSLTGQQIDRSQDLKITIQDYPFL